MTNEAAKTEIPPRNKVPPPQEDSLVEKVHNLLLFVGENSLLALRVLQTLLRQGVHTQDLLRQMAAIGVDSVWIVLANNLATGAVFALYIAVLALQLGFPEFVGGTLAYAFLNEMGPMLTGIALASRCGSAIAAEIGSMVVTEQVEALRAMAVSPVRYLVVPRVLAATLMLPLLTILGDIAGILGGWASSLANGIPSQTFWDSVHKYAHPPDITRGLIKSVVFGFLVGLVACQQGLRTKGGATGVGRATTNSVVLCVVLIFIADFFLAQILTKVITLRP